MLAAATLVKSPIVRCVLGTQADRRTGIEQHIAETVRVLKASRSRIMDAGVKMAIENHAGDMQARELKSLIEAAGPEYVGVCLDSGNPVWTIEDPHLTLETLAPYVLTSHMRDSYLFNSPRGIGGAVDAHGRRQHGHGRLPAHVRPEVPGQTRFARGHRQSQLPDLQLSGPAGLGDFQDDARWEFSRFLALADRGIPKPLPEPGQGRGGGPGRGAQPNPEALKRNLEDVEASVKWTQAFLATL